MLKENDFTPEVYSHSNYQISTREEQRHFQYL